MMDTAPHVPTMNRPPSLFVRVRRRLAELLAPGLHYSLKRKFWTESWRRGDFPSPSSFWFLPDGVVPRHVEEVVREGWFPRSGHVVDIGCGDGRIAAYLARAGYDALGVDFAAPAIERARARFGESGGLRYQTLDISEQAPGPGFFDAVVDRGCFHGLPNHLRSAYIRNLVACTRPGSRLLLMCKLTGDVKVRETKKRRLEEQVLEEVRRHFAPYFDTERSEAIVYNSRGDDAEAGSIPGLVLRMTRKDQ